METDASSKLLSKVAIGSFVTGILIAVLGIVFVCIGTSGDTQFNFFGQSFQSTNVGITAIFIGAALIVLNIRRVLKSHDLRNGHQSLEKSNKSNRVTIPVHRTNEGDRGIHVNVVQVVGEREAAQKCTRADGSPQGEMSVKFNMLQTYDSDVPPLVDIWVGRDSEVSLFDGIESGVVVITGIGGQGKSTLAAKVLQRHLEKRSVLFWDWRDCREEANRFRTHLVSVIEHRTQGDVSAAMLVDADMPFLSKFLFKKLETDDAMIVFDNVDHYVDIDQSLFVSDISTFITEALRVEHRTLLVFTCRPRISYASPRFREIYLRGLSVEETITLFSLRNQCSAKLEMAGIVRRFHSLTDGHPLWLNIIASQIGRKQESAELILKSLEGGKTDDRANAMLRGVWQSLNETQQNILRTMAELPRAVTESAIYEYVAGKVPTYNRFDRAFRGLKAVSLVTAKGGMDTGEPRYELHPMVTAFIRTEYGERGERNKLLDTLILCCNHIVLRLRTRESNVLSIDVLEQMTTQAELQLSRGNVMEAIKTLQDSADSMVARGLQEELFRLCDQVFLATDWQTSEWIEDATFGALVRTVIKTMVEQGRAALIESVLEMYTAATRTGTVAFVEVCDLNAYVNWFIGKHTPAMRWADRGIELKARGGIDTSSDCEHTRALAWRDFGRARDALQVFLCGNELSLILAENHMKAKRGAPFYGNIGRCLYLDGETDKSIVLFTKAFEILSQQDDATSILNRGYAALWIGEALLSLGRKDEARNFLSLAIAIWTRRAPQKVPLADELLARCGQSLSQESMPEPTLITWCKEWIVDFQKTQ